MSDFDMIRALKQNDARLRQTEVKETVGHIGSFTSFYATGTYTPTYLGLTTPGATTYLIQEGEWVRLGRTVFCNGRINWSAATGTGQAAISLPFACANTYRTTGSLFIDGVTFANTMPEMLVTPGQQYFTMFSALTNAAPTAVNIEAAGLVIWNLTYFI